MSDLSSALTDDSVGVAARHERRRRTACELSVILPTYNEAENLPILLDRLIQILADVDHEIIVVDDNSPDGTWQVAADYAEQWPRIRSVRRTSDRGLSSAVIAGMEIAEGRVFAVMDSDLQHDEAALLAIVQPVLDGDADVSLGSREAEGGSYGEWSNWRRFVSWGGKQLARKLLGVPVSDPMSGFFAVSRERYESVAGMINPKGFKILLEFLARGPRPRATEVGYHFRDRVHGSTKLTGSVVGAYLLALIDLVVGRVVSATFTAYAMVGALGLLVRLSLGVVLTSVGVQHAMLFAFEASVLCNYLLNNTFTFSPERHRGTKIIPGFLMFQIVALHGLAVNWGLAAFATGDRPGFDLALSHPVALISMVVAVAGNYILNRAVTWRR